MFGKQVGKPELVPVLSLTLDYEVYPRTGIDSIAVSDMVRALEAGEVFPPIVVDKKSKRVVDGFHRCKSRLRYEGNDAKIEAIWKTYKDDGELMLDAAYPNSMNGTKLNSHDRVHFVLLAEVLGVSRPQAARALRMSVERLTKLMDDRTGQVRGSNRQLGVKSGLASLFVEQGRKMNQAQEDVNRRYGGMAPIVYVNMIIDLLDNDMIDWRNERLVDRLKVLYASLGRELAARKKKRA
jgi:hypothetical protein